MSRESNYRTEFVAVLSNQPQGGFESLRPTADASVASRSSWGDHGYGYFDQRNPDSAIKQYATARRLLSGATLVELGGEKRHAIVVRIFFGDGFVVTAKGPANVNV